MQLFRFASEINLWPRSNSILRNLCRAADGDDDNDDNDNNNDDNDDDDDED